MNIQANVMARRQEVEKARTVQVIRDGYDDENDQSIAAPAQMPPILRGMLCAQRTR